MLRLVEEAKRQGEVLHIVRDHLLVEKDGVFHLLDTGVPDDIAAPAIVSEQLGVRVTRLVGTRELSRTPFRVDWQHRRVTFGAVRRPGAVRHEIRMSPLGVPLIDLVHRGRSATAVFDLGAPVSYMPTTATAGLPMVRQASDFLPMFGEFETPLYRTAIDTGAVSTPCECGVLPDLLQLALGLMLPDGWIVGTAILKDRVTVVDLADGALYFERW